MKIGQISFSQMTTPVDRPYGHPELGQQVSGSGQATPSKMYSNRTVGSTSARPRRGYRPLVTRETSGVGTKPARYLPARDSMNGSHLSLRAMLPAMCADDALVGCERVLRSRGWQPLRRPVVPC